MAETPAITDRNLEATTNISLKREPACFAFLSPRSICPPMPIDSINLDLASADYFGGRASLWAALEMRSSVSDERPTAILGFDETFLRPFARALIEAATTRAAYRMSILQESRTSERCRVVEYVTGPGKALEELMLQPFDNVVLISATKDVYYRRWTMPTARGALLALSMVGIVFRKSEQELRIWYPQFQAELYKGQ